MVGPILHHTGRHVRDSLPAQTPNNVARIGGRQVLIGPYPERLQGSGELAAYAVN